jgi:hypothetical protein
MSIFPYLVEQCPVAVETLLGPLVRHVNKKMHIGQIIFQAPIRRAANFKSHRA